MSITWVLVANARSATLYENQGPNKGLTIVKQIEPEANGLVDDISIGAMDRTAWHGPGDLRRNRAKGFAHRLAGELRSGRNRNRFAQAVLVAPPAFMGLLNAELDSPTAQRVSGRLEKDYTKNSTSDLCGKLGDCLCP